MFKFVGLFLLTISSLGFGLGNFSLEVCLFFLLGLFLVCSKEISPAGLKNKVKAELDKSLKNYT